VKKLFLPLFMALIGLLFPPSLTTTPFELRIVDEETGRGVSGLRVTADNGIVYHTQAGDIYWWASSVMNRDVRFEILDERNQYDNVSATLRVTPGRQATLTVRRRS
jgi:hypothetical protein